MNIKVHRGLNQIGGCITEIWTETSRVFIDFGQNLAGNGEPTTPEQDKALVEGILSQNQKEHQAVLYTHAHDDHIGLFQYIPDSIPQYIGEGAKEMLLARYHYLIVVAKLNSWDFADKEMQMAKIEAFRTYSRNITEPINIGDIKITSFLSCHSIYDSYMFLIEADGKRIWHTGDYRANGYLGQQMMGTIRLYAKDIDVLISEGTMLSQEEDHFVNERTLIKKMSLVMQAFKYVFVLATPTDVERLATVKRGAQDANKELYINSGYMNATMSIFTRREATNARSLFYFAPLYFSLGEDWKKIQREGFVLISALSKLEEVKSMVKQLSPAETILIYSTWDGHYKIPEMVEINPKYKEFREAFQNVVDIRTSDHADRTTIKKVMKIINPKDVIFIHKDAGAEVPLLK